MNPSTNCPHCVAELLTEVPHGDIRYKCGYEYDQDHEVYYRTDLCREREAHNKTREELEKMKGEATREIMLRDKSEKRCEVAEAENQKLRELSARLISKLEHSHFCDTVLGSGDCDCDCYLQKASSELESIEQLTK